MAFKRGAPGPGWLFGGQPPSMRASRRSPKTCLACRKSAKVINAYTSEEVFRRRYACDCGQRWTTSEARIREESLAEKPLQKQIREHIEACENCTPLKACSALLDLHAALLKQLKSDAEKSEPRPADEADAEPT